MSSPVITVENLGKTYQLSHLGRPRYSSLRDAVAERARRIFRREKGGDGGSRTEEFWALKDVSFEVGQGEVVGIIGRNGAGKSTLLKILSRITEPTTGRVSLRGRVASLLEVGTGFHPELTGRDNIFLNGAILGMKKAEIVRRFDEIVAFAEVERFLDTPVKHYSSGMYVRLAFAVAAHLEPEILVVDEVLAVGDAEFQKKCLGKMQDVSRGGRTVLFVSHNMSAIESLSTAGLLLDGGRVRNSGPIDRVIGEYNSSLWRGGSPSERLTRLVPTIELGRLEIAPTGVRRGEPVLLTIQLVPQSRTTIREMALLVYSERGVRVAILDLRREGVCDLVLSDQAVTFEVDVEELPLVEGDYRLGLYLVTNEHTADLRDIAAFSVAASAKEAGVLSYAAQHRGFVDLRFRVRAAETVSV